MKFFIITLVILLSACKGEQSNSEMNKSFSGENSYLGQNPPGKTPEAFAPNLVTTTNWEYGGVFNPEMTEFYFLRQVEESEEQEFVVYEKRDNQWNEVVISSRQGQPFISPDGKTMHLGSRYMERIDTNKWSDVKKLDFPFNKFPIMRLTASTKGTYFFDEFKQDLTGDIRYSRIKDGKYSRPQLLSEKINTGRSFHPFIAPDESYLIFDSYREEGYGNSDIYISYRKQDGTWGTPINLGPEINTEAWEASASVTPDGKYLFFNRMIGPNENGNVDIFWVDSQVVGKLKPKE